MSPPPEHGASTPAGLPASPSQDAATNRQAIRGRRAQRPDDTDHDSLWERHAAWWQESFTDGADVEYVEQIFPLAAAHLAGATDVLDIGTGEGQLARLAASPAVGAGRVVGIDPARAQIDAARAKGGGPEYVRAAADHLPFPDATFDAALACLVLEHIGNLDAVVNEIGRVLRAGGRLVLFMNHPLLHAPGSGWIDDHILEEQYWRIGPYLAEDTSLQEVDKDVFLPFVHRPLSRYVNAMAAAGLVIRHMDEPPPPPGFLDGAATVYPDAHTIPRLLVLRAEKLSQPVPSSTA